MNPTPTMNPPRGADASRPSSIIAQRVADALPVRRIDRLPGGAAALIVDCDDYDAFRMLPRVVAFDGRRYGLTGWHSDWQIACYRSDVALAQAVALTEGGAA